MPTPMPFPQPDVPQGGLPVGAICAYAGRVRPVSNEPNAAMPRTLSGDSAATHADLDHAPVLDLETQGWMVCDGRTLQAAEFPQLFAALGYLYGGQDDHFKIPDTRGLFLRGVDVEAGIDPDASWRTAPTGSGTGAGVGSLQHDALQDHVHAHEGASSSRSTITSSSGSGGESHVAGTAPSATGSPAEPASVNEEQPEGLPARVSSETRPVNLAVHYVIKFR